MITGGLGFIGTNLVKYWRQYHPSDRIIVLDAETYAANQDVKALKPKVEWERVDIRYQSAVARVMREYRPDLALHLAAESHVCRSIVGPRDFVTTNVLGTFNLLEEWKQLHDSDPTKPFVHVSTDEVFGELGPEDPPFTEQSPIRARSPYAASKAASDVLALAYWETYSLPVRVTNCSNNFGPHQHGEKLIPATIDRIAAGKAPRIYGDGRQVRDWLYVWDHCRALDAVAEHGFNGERYCVGGDCELTNLAIVRRIWDLCPAEHRKAAKLKLEYIPDARPTDDRRYAIDSSKLKSIGWMPHGATLFENQLRTTIGWYLDKLGVL
jgi:dTDP-glucose 4,6-dehydratase